ncbi:hypothetical protein CNMCM7691_005712 [Aspergillus felis]|uniref:Uncharacterized protein n=1 Tax=Aspergillus felis TaxID=1287682 RepID=A0A8H6QQT9_9EURO|nr:hypothetical protein CNMCM7691_005712 [Aspergillus felis]
MASELVNEYFHDNAPSSQDDWSLIMGAPMSQFPLTIPHPVGQGVGYSAGSTVPGGSEMGPINAFGATPSAMNGAADSRESFESVLQTLASPFAHQYTNSKETVGAWEGSMPPCYSLGITALGPLGESAYISPYLDPVRSTIDRFWNLSVTSSGSEHAAPQIFLAASLLDALFQLSMPAHSSRHESINEAYKWVAIAAASQFTVQQATLPGTGGSHGRARDIALATWQKAKQMVFENIAATRSFRLTLCLLLFGTLFPPTTPEGSNVLEDAAYATQEGLQRLQMLCAEARAHCVHDPDMSLDPPYRTSRVEAASKPHPVRTLPTSVRKYILELIAAVEWLASMSHSAAVVYSRIDTCTAPRFAYCNRSSLWTIDIMPEQGAKRQHKQKFEDSIIARAQADTHRVTALWSLPISDDIVARAVSQASSIAILLWQTLAILTLTFEQLRTDKAQYEELHRCYAAMTNLIDVWRSAWGQIDRSAAVSLHQSRPNVLRSVHFCSTDVDLAILLFCELIFQLESQLAEQISLSSSSSPARERLWNTLKEKSDCHRDQRRTSAMQISHLAMASQGVLSPGFQGKSGLKANVEDISAHPYPTLVVHAHRLAAKALADEIQCSISQMDAKRIPELTVGLESCMQGLQRLQGALVMFPEMSSDIDRLFQ